MLGLRTMEHDEWICFARPMLADDLAIGWRPAEWAKDDRGYAVSASRNGVLVGEVYLHQIPTWVLEQANTAWEHLKLNDERSVMRMVTYHRVRRGQKWYLEPIEEVVS